MFVSVEKEVLKIVKVLESCKFEQTSQNSSMLLFFRTWELEGKLKSFYHGSVDSLMYNAQRGSIHDVDDCFKSQCNQIFIGLITMQYQAKPVS